MVLPPQIYVYQKPVNMTLFANVLVELERGHLWGPNPVIDVLLIKENTQTQGSHLKIGMMCLQA